MLDRYEPLIQELKLQNIVDYEIWPCIIKSDVVSSINASHKMIVREAKEKGEKEACIAEDDLMFTCRRAWDFYLKNKPDSFDIYLACSYVVPIDYKKICGFHLYIVHERFYDKFLSIPDDVHIDTYFDTVEGEYVFCHPFPALQRPGWSSNNKAKANYNSILRPEDIYKG